MHSARRLLQVALAVSSFAFASSQSVSSATVVTVLDSPKVHCEIAGHRHSGHLNVRAQDLGQQKYDTLDHY